MTYDPHRNKLRFITRDFKQILQQELLDLDPNSESVGKWIWEDVPLVSAQIPGPPDRGAVQRNELLICEDCGWMTDELEARLRNFNTGACAKCDGVLIERPEGLAVEFDDDEEDPDGTYRE